jgi:diguanylate cyclase (GGDEF)-like protein
LSYHAQHSQDASDAEPHEIAARVWWLGSHRCDDPRYPSNNSYLIEQGEDSVLINPGSRRNVQGLLRRLGRIIPLHAVRWWLCLQVEHDSVSALWGLDTERLHPAARVVAGVDGCGQLRNAGLRLRLHPLEPTSPRLDLADRCLRLISTPFVGHADAFCIFDERADTLFPADLFSSADLPEMSQKGGVPYASATDLERLTLYQQQRIPTGAALDHALAALEGLPIRLIASRRGALIPAPLVPEAIDRLRGLPCGIDLLSDHDAILEQDRLIADSLRRITEVMLLARDFGDMARTLETLIRPTVPLVQAEYYADLGDRRILALRPQSHFVAITEHQPPDVCGFIGRRHQDWVDAHRLPPWQGVHQLCRERFCQQPAEDGRGALITVPLRARGQERIEAIALFRVRAPIPLGSAGARLLILLAEPLQVALAREVDLQVLEREREAAYRRSIRDPLTGLFTRIYMTDVITRQCGLHSRDPGACLSVCMLDLDHFKQVNDTHGHAAGDAVLAHVATIIRETARATDVAVRYGGEELLIFTIGQTLTGATRLAERLRERICKTPTTIDGGVELGVTVSIGVAEHAPGETLEQLLRRADAALYQAKHRGRDRVEVAPAEGDS